MSYCHWTKSLHTRQNPRRKPQPVVSMTWKQVQAAQHYAIERIARGATKVDAIHELRQVLRRGGLKRSQIEERIEAVYDEIDLVERDFAAFGYGEGGR